MRRTKFASVRLLIFANNKDCTVSPEKKKCVASPDVLAAKQRYTRAVDESGEDYLYPSISSCYLAPLSQENGFEGGLSFIGRICWVCPKRDSLHERRFTSLAIDDVDERISRAAFAPAMPMTPPPGWAAAPQR